MLDTLQHYVSKREAILFGALGLILGWVFYGPLPKWTGL